MPIKQDRFITILRGAKLLLDIQRSIMQVAKDADQITSTARGAIDHITDPALAQALLPLFGIINTLVDLAKSKDNEYIDLVATVLAEIKYFDKVKISNDRVAKRQQEARERKGIKPRQDYLLGEQLAPSMTPTLQPLYLEGTSNYAADQGALPKPIEETQGYKNFEKRMQKIRAAKSTEEGQNQ